MPHTAERDANVAPSTRSPEETSRRSRLGFCLRVCPKAALAVARAGSVARKARRRMFRSPAAVPIHWPGVLSEPRTCGPPDNLLLRLGPLDARHDHRPGFVRIAPAEHLHPLGRFEVLVVLEEV